MYLLSRGLGFPVLFMHGIPISSHLWNATVDELPGRFSCLAIDLLGLGRSPNDRGRGNQLEALAEWIERIRTEHF
jgi:haloalkane dehalogenase